MDITFAHFKNILSFDEVEINFSELDFALFQGKSGSGKSAIFDALCWVIFGTTARKKYKKIGRDLPKKQTRIYGRVDFSEGNSEYIVERTGSKDGLKLWMDGGLVELRNPTLLQARIEEIIGMDFKTFLNVAYFSQGDIGKFLSAESSERIKIISDILNLEKLDKLRDTIAKELVEIEKTVEFHKGQIIALQELNNVIDIEKIQKEKKFLRSALTKVTEDMTKVGNYLDCIKEKKKLSDQLLVIKQRYDREIESAKLYIKEINQEILNLRDRVDNSQELREKIAEVSKSLEDWEYYTQMKDKESEEIQRLEKLVSKNKAKYEMMKEQKDALQSVLGLKGSECPTCHTLITEKNIQHIQSLASQINKDVMECVQSIKKLKSDIEIHTNSRNRAADNLARLNKLKTEEIKLKEKLKEVLERGTRIEQLKQKIANHKAASAQIIDKIKADYNNKKGDLGFYKKYDAEKLDEYQQMYEQLESKRQITENKEKEIDFQIKSYYNNNSKIKDIKQLIEKDSERFEIMTFWTKSLPKIKVEMIGEVIPFIESEANKYLSQILSGKMIKFTVDPNKNSNKLDITIHDYENGVDRIFEGWCGGEKDSMCMCTFMALNKLASVRNKKQIPFIILDEKFASVESEKRTKWLDMLRREYKGRKIWAISHAHGIETEFDQIVKMTKQNHVSSFEIVNNFHQ